MRNVSASRIYSASKSEYWTRSAAHWEMCADRHLRNFFDGDDASLGQAEMAYDEARSQREYYADGKR